MLLERRNIGERQQWASEKMATLPVEEQKKYELAAKVCPSQCFLTHMILNRQQSRYHDKSKIKDEAMKKKSSKVLALSKAVICCSFS